MVRFDSARLGCFDGSCFVVADLAGVQFTLPDAPGVNFRAKRIIAPLARALRAGGRLIGIHSHGHDPGLEIIQAVWPGENPFTVSRHELLRAVK